MPARNVAREPKIFISGANFLSPAKARAIADRNDMPSKMISVILPEPFKRFNLFKLFNLPLVLFF
ncbi:MAG: hypothetical protein A2235_01365 [Deltaproteobacteria bacterium RIFOXYA2_FULL_42_10]|nr:MAG: hypothetical protein A2235_01365 [Deltaproteobacteria bacterium RIFOXYA2_FULL_42_10]